MKNSRQVVFSVVIPLYNKEQYVGRAIQSVLDQTFHDFELIIVDNGSTDKGREISAAFDDERIELLDEQRRGVSNARNTGIDASRGSYITFLDADDYWHKDNLMNLHKLINEAPNAVMYSNSYRIIEANGTVRTRELSCAVKRNGYDVLTNFFRSYAAGDLPVNMNSVCIPKEVLLRAGKFEAAIDFGEDTYLWSQIFLMGDVIIGDYVGSTYVRNAEDRSDIPAKLLGEFVVNTYFDDLLKQEKAKPFEADIRAVVARQVFMNLLSNIKAGRRKEAIRISKDKRLDWLYSKRKLGFIKALAYIPGSIARMILNALFLLKITR